jgi:uncharacterized protein YydD (DUF2326 family)
MDEVKAGEAQEPIAEAKKDAVLTQADVAKMLDEQNKTWQSRFDKVLAEKKQTEVKANTVEERIAQLEAERIKERLEFTRKESKAKASIDDDMDAAVRDYASNDAEAIARGAERLKELWTAKEKTYKDRIDELEKKLQFGSRTPHGGQTPDAKTAMQTRYNELLKAGKRDEANRLYIQMGMQN